MKIKEIRQDFISIFPKIFIKTAIWYGDKQGQDIDIFIIFRNNVAYNSFRYQQFDISYTNETEIKTMLSNFDPLITEPILTGQEIYGQHLAVLKKELLSTRTNNSTVEYLINRAREFYNWSQEHLMTKNHRETAIALTFVISFIHFADYYKHHEQVITLKKLIKNIPNNLLSETITLTKNINQINKSILGKLSQEIKKGLDKH